MMLVRMYFTDPGTISQDVMDQMSLRIQAFLSKHHNVPPNTVGVIFSKDYYSKALLQEGPVDAVGVSVKKVRIEVSGDRNAASWLKDFLVEMFSYKGQVAVVQVF